MQLLADFFPLLLFFLAYTFADIYVATGVAMAASVIQIAYFYWHRGHVGVVPWLTMVMIVVFGGATLYFHDNTFIRWKPTVLYALFATILLVGKVGFRRDLISYVMKGITLPSPVWTRLTWAWVTFFACMSVANWYVAFNFSERTWVMFKFWGATGLLLAFSLGMGVYLARHMAEEPE